jgi:transposase
MRNHREQKLIEELNNIAIQIKKTTNRNPSEIERRLGRLSQKYSSVAKYYWFEYKQFEFSITYPEKQINRKLKKSLDTIQKKYNESEISYNELHKQLRLRQEKYPLDYAKLDIQITEPSLQWGTEEDKENNQHQLEGNYLLKTNRTDLQSEEIWNIYTMLTKVEKAFRDLKTHLGLRPNYHQLEKRVDGHIFISILAYHLLHTIEYVLNQQEISASWKTIKRLVSTHTYATIQVPVVDKTTVNLRKPGAVEGIHEKIYRKLGVNYKDLPTLKTTAK